MKVIAFERRSAAARLRALQADEQTEAPELDSPRPQKTYRDRHGLHRLLYQAGLKLSPAFVIGAALLSGLLAALVFSKLLSVVFVPLFFLLGAAAPFLWIENRVRSRALEFAKDYPTMLLAAASSVKVGLTPYQALERSTRLLPKESLVRTEVEGLLRRLRAGYPRELAVHRFGAAIRQPDLELFRSAFLLVLENGGRFSPTLVRLAGVSNNRAVLIRSAAVSTASMRMTANILNVIAPVLVLMIAARTEHFWDIFLNNPAANFIGSTGILVIIVCHAVLRHMSNFKP